MPSSRRVLISVLTTLLASTVTNAAQPMPKPQESFAPYWTAEPGWETELQLRNNLAAGALTVTPVLRLASGREILLDPVTISANAATTILVSDGLLKRAPGLLNQPGTFGSVAFRYTALHARNLSAVAAVHMHAQPIGYHVDAFPVSHGPSGGSLEGIWWQPRPGVKNVVVISNSSDKTIGGTLSLSDPGGRQSRNRWSLAAHQTKRMNVDDLVRQAGLSGNYGGIAFASPSFAPALDGVHFLYDEMAGFSALMNMFDRDPAAKLEERTWAGNKQWTMWAPMLALQTPDPAAGFPGGTVLEPIIFLRNATAKRLSASITLTWRGDSAKGRVQLPEVNLQPFETRQLEIGPMQKRLGIPEDAHWALVTLTSPASPDDLLAVAASYDSTGRYGAQTPFSDNLGAYWAGGQWQVDATHNALVAVTNGGTRTTEALLTLHFDDGRKNYEVQQTIQPGEQMWLNFADLIHHSVPDRKGNVLPADVTAGTYDLEDLNPGLGGNLIEGKVALDKTWGHLTYGCLTCCGYTPYLSPDPGNVVVNGLLQIDTFGTNNCSGQKGYGLSGYYQSTGVWWSGNSAIAQVTAFQGKGMAPGTTTGYGKAVIPNGDGGRPKPPCPELDQLAGNQIPVQVPTSLKVLSVTILPDGVGPPNGCPGSANYGIKVDIKYQVMDQNSKPIASSSMIAHEKGTFFDGSPLDSNIGPVLGYPTSSKTTASDGTFHDVPFGACSSVPISNPGVTATQNITMIMPDGSSYPVRSQTATVTAPGTASFGHGTIKNNITSPGSGSDINATR